MAVKVVTDSTCDLPRDLANELGIIIVPLTVRFGEESYYDGVDLIADDFYSKLMSSKDLPTTAAPAPGAFAEVYRRLLTEGHQVLSLHISSKLSATSTSASNGRDQLGPGEAVEVIDTLSVSMGLGLLVLRAARAARGGGKLGDIAELVKALMADVRLYGAFDTLRYLQKGGRIGKASALLGSLLNLKPMVLVHEGEVHPLTKARTRTKAVDRLVELVAAAKVEDIGVMHATTPGDMEALARRVSAAANGKEVIKAQFGPVLGTYVGPGILGVAFIEGK